MKLNKKIEVRRDNTIFHMSNPSLFTILISLILIAYVQNNPVLRNAGDDFCDGN